MENNRVVLVLTEQLQAYPGYSMSRQWVAKVVPAWMNSHQDFVGMLICLDFTYLARTCPTFLSLFEYILNAFLFTLNPFTRFHTSMSESVTNIAITAVLFTLICVNIAGNSVVCLIIKRNLHMRLLRLPIYDVNDIMW